MKKLLSLFIISISLTTFSQSNELAEFQKNLVKVKNKDSLKNITSEIQNIEKQLNSEDAITINQSTKWKLFCYTVNGWSQIVGRPKSTTNDKYVSNTKELVTTENLLKIFNLKYNDSMFLKNFPLVFEREDFYNRKTTPIIIKNKYLILRYVHSYPNGNQTSWYNEMNYYFAKVED